MLNDPEFGKHLPSQSHRRLAIDGNVEATFSVDEPDNPTRIQPFLLITCAHRIFTWRSRTSSFWEEVPESAQVAWDAQAFQHMAEFY